MFWRVSRLALATSRRSANGNRFFQTQVSRTVPVLPTILIDTNLNGSMAAHTQSHSERLLEGALIRFSYQGGSGLASNAPGCASSPLHPCRVTTASPDCGSSPVRPSRAAPWQDSIPALLSTGSPGICSRRPCVHVALTCMAWCESNGVEGGIAAPSAPMRQP